jgi:hypothetical protein
MAWDSDGVLVDLDDFLIGQMDIGGVAEDTIVGTGSMFDAGDCIDELIVTGMGGGGAADGNVTANGALVLFDPSDIGIEFGDSQHSIAGADNPVVGSGIAGMLIDFFGTDPLPGDTMAMIDFDFVFYSGGAAAFMVFFSSIALGPGIYNYWRTRSMDYYTKSQPAKSEELVNVVEVPVKPLAPKAAPEEVYSKDLTIAASTTTVFEVKYSSIPCLVDGASASLEDETAGVSIVQPYTFYAWGASISIRNTAGTSGTCTLKVDATPLEVVGEEIVVSTDSTSVRENGTLKYSYPGNHLIQNRDIAERIADNLLDTYSTPRKDVSVVWRGNPAIDTTDIIEIPEYQKQGLDIRGDFAILKQQHEFDGTLKTTTEARKVIDA